ncbi:MAG: hypothetical protein OEZ34_04185 [Spirochaetia bacterium]|nr:hypothetical protein [Spirochaetia bacterium]
MYLHPILKGFIAFIPPWIILFLADLYSLQMQAESFGYPFQYSPMHSGIIGILCLFTGGMLGTFAGRIRTHRRLKLTAGTLIIYWVDALMVAAVIISLGEKLSLSEKLTGTLWLGSVGALIFAIFVCPVLLVAALILEIWTRDDLKSGIKNVQCGTIQKKREAMGRYGNLHFITFLDKEYTVDVTTFTRFDAGDKVEISFSDKGRAVLGIKKSDA